MDDFKVLNAFFNIIQGNETGFIRYLFSSYQDFCVFKEWLLKKDIHLMSLDIIDEELHKMISPKMSAAEISILTHCDFNKDMKDLALKYKNRLQMVLLPSLDCHYEYHLDIDDDSIDYYEIKDVFHRSNLSFYDPFPAFITAINHCDLWGGVLLFNDENEVFYAINSDDDINFLYQHLNDDNLFELLQSFNHDSYFIHVSDLHLGREKSTRGLNQLYMSLDHLIPKLHSYYKTKFFITGDLMDSPNRRNMYMANDFMIELKKKYKADITFILGNHDVIVHGLNMARTQKSKIIAYLLGEHVKVIESEKLVIVKIDSTSEGNLARGKVGVRQLLEIDDELEAIENLDDYTILVMLHHHVYPISKADFLKSAWHESHFIGRIIETSKVLVDSDLLIDWLNKKNIQYVFHGHKHLPFFRKEGNTYIVSGGSSTGSLKESSSRYISYNVLKYNVEEKKMKTCIIFYDDKSKMDCQRLEVYLFKEDEKNEVIR